MKFSIRAMFAAVLVAAIAATTIRTDVVPISLLPIGLWLAGVAPGIFLARGRSLRCVLFAAIGGILGATLGAGSIGFFDQMSFTTWYSPFMLILIGGLAGAFVGCLVRVIMEGLTLSTNPAASKNRELNAN